MKPYDTAKENGETLKRILQGLGVAVMERWHRVFVDSTPMSCCEGGLAPIDNYVSYPSYLESELQNGIYKENDPKRLQYNVYPDKVEVLPWYNVAPKIMKTIRIGELDSEALKRAIMDVKKQIA